MYSITQNSHSTEYVSEKSNRFFQQYQIGKILKAANGKKLQEIPARYVLFDTWFCFPSFIATVKGMEFA